MMSFQELIPGKVRPRWGRLPALAWLTAGVFQSRFLRRVRLRRATQVSTWPVQLFALVTGQADGAVAAVGDRAVVIVRELSRTGGRRSWRVTAAGVGGALMVAVVVFGPAVFLAFVGIQLGGAGGAACLVAAVLLLTCPVVLGTATVWPAVRAGIPAQRRRARAWALDTYPRVAEATTLAGDPTDRHVVTQLLRPLQRIADREQIAVVAQTHDPDVATWYLRVGFRPVPGLSTALCRPPRQRQAHTTTDR